MAGRTLLEEGRRAFERCEWSLAYARMSEADAAAALGSPEDLERLAIAAHLVGRDEESTLGWTRAHRARLRVGETERAVWCAFWLGFGLFQRGDTARGGGWMARARRLVEDHGLDCVGAGYLLLPDALAALGSGDHSRAHDLSVEAERFGRRFHDADLTALGHLGRGQARLHQGRAEEGLGLFDEAMVSVTAGELSPTVAGIVYCAVIDECRRAFDIRRAREWTFALTHWCDAQPGLVPYRGQCLVHRSQVLQLRGAWREALEEARRARDHLAEPPHPALGMAHYQLAELHRLRGDFGQAEDAYRRAHECGRDPQPGLALLRIAQGRVDAATAAVEQALGAAAGDTTARVDLLQAFIEVMLAAGRTDDARAAVSELVGLASRVDIPYVHAAAARARGAVLLAGGEPAAALDALRGACRRWQRLEAPYEAAQARTLIAVACSAVGDRDGADLERAAARRVFEELGAAPAIGRLEELTGGGPGHPDVTPREWEVLRLVAAGRTNREIAEALVISDKTVERHLSNIFAKLDVPNRTAAAAYARGVR